MTSRPYANSVALAAAVLGFAVPTAAAAGSGPGNGGPTGGAGLNSTSTSVATATPVGGPVTAQGNGFTLTSTATGTYQRNLSFSGSVPSGDSNDVVAIQRLSSAGTWQSVTQATVAADGSFVAGWRADTSGLVGFRASLEGPAGSIQAASVAPGGSSPTLAVTIYRNAIATIYGPGFYGRKTACGIKLSASTIGVASRTLKCGTKVSIDYDGQTITVPVIDRGPYANGASWDLTEATAQALGDPETETIGAAVL